MRKSGWSLVGVMLVALVALCSLSGGALALPVGRHFEVVSPAFKDGFGATKIGAVAPDGEGVVYLSPGIFDGAPSGPELSNTNYFARRNSSEWATVPLVAPVALLAESLIKDLSPTLSLELDAGKPGPNSENKRLGKEDLLLHSTDLPDTVAGWHAIDELEALSKGPVELDYKKADPNFCHLLFLTTGSAVLLGEAEGTLGGTNGQLYEFNRGCGGEAAALTLVGVNNDGKILNRGCGVEPGIENYASAGDNYNAISADGGEVFFTDCLSGTTGPETPHQLFVRLAGSKTLEVSRAREAGKPSGGCIGEGAQKTAGEVPCEGALARASADFAGASEDGSSVFFTARLAAGQQPLVPGNTDASDNLYRAQIGCPEDRPGCKAAEREVTSLTQVSHNPNGGTAEVQGVVRAAPDGQRVYFVAGGDLLSRAQQQARESEGRTVPHVGAANLYTYSVTSETTAFVGDLCSGAELSGTVEDISCPNSEADTPLWTSGVQTGGESQAAGSDGRFLVFSSYAQLTGDDTSSAREVYRYDAETGILVRVSVGENGYDANGTGGVLGARIAEGHHGGASVREQYEMDNRAVSEDGSRIVFRSAEPLSPAASNGRLNAYEWHEGSVSLVSTGSDEEPVEEVVISPNGLSVFFVTVQGLVPRDTDGAPDIYDARLGEGFPSLPAERRPCEGDSCPGPLTNPAPLLVPGSVGQAPGGNFQTSKPAVKSKKKIKAKKRHPIPRKRRGGKERSSGRSSRGGTSSGRSER
jgi:hypothetical protein